jgi:hypothetical protein
MHHAGTSVRTPSYAHRGPWLHRRPFTARSNRIHSAGRPAGRGAIDRRPQLLTLVAARASLRWTGEFNWQDRTTRWIRWVGWSPSIRLWACARFFARSWLRVRDKRSQSENGLIPCSGLQFVRLMIGRSINPSVVVSSMPAPSCSFLAGVVGYIDAVC